MAISERKKKILAAVVDEYIQTAEPVGSKTIAQTAGLGCSSATIRNELAELVSLGYLEQPHTSAGRVPTPKGYRMYVNELMQRQKLSTEETEDINRRMNQRLQQLDDTIGDISRLASQLTDYPALALTTRTAVTIKRVDLIYVDANTFIIVLMLSDNSVKSKLVHLPLSVDQRLHRTRGGRYDRFDLRYLRFRDRSPQRGTCSLRLCDGRKQAAQSAGVPRPGQGAQAHGLSLRRRIHPPA